jgi:hypothetical protein
MALEALVGSYQAVPIAGMISDTVARNALVDASSHALEVITHEHHEIHDAASFTCHFTNDCTNTGEMTIIAFKTSNTTKWLHVVAEASSSAGAYLAIYENSDLDLDEGTALTVFNRNRNSSVVSTVLSLATPAVAGQATSFNETQAAGATLSVATELYRWYMGAATAGGDAAGESRELAEFVLKQNTQYAFVVVSTSDDNNTHNIVLSWYENEDRN